MLNTKEPDLRPKKKTSFWLLYLYDIGEYILVPFDDVSINQAPAPCPSSRKFRPSACRNQHRVHPAGSSARLHAEITTVLIWRFRRSSIYEVIIPGNPLDSSEKPELTAYLRLLSVHVEYKRLLFSRQSSAASQMTKSRKVSPIQAIKLWTPWCVLSCANRLTCLI